MSIKQISLIGMGVSTVGGFATGSYFLLSDNNSIKKELIKEKKTILDINADNVYWEIKLSTYTREQKIKNNLALEKDEISYLKDWCNNTLSSKFNNKEEKNYNSARELCTVPNNKERLLKEGKALATTTQHWTSKETQYKDTNNQSLISTISKNTAKWTEIQNWCNENINNEYKKDDQNINSLILKWCTEQGS